MSDKEKELDEILSNNATLSEQGANKDVETLTDDYLKSIKDFEENSIEILKRDNKRAWGFAIGASVIAFAAVAAVSALVPLKETEPFLVYINEETGQSRLAKPLSDAKEISYGEVLDKHWLSQFITARNGYEWETVRNDYDLVQLMSADKVFKAYHGYITAKNSPAEIFKEDRKIKIDDVSVSFLPANPLPLAQVYFTRKILNPDGTPDRSYEVTAWNATVTFDYKKSIKKETERNRNPLGFRVTSYREDQAVRK